MESKDWPLVIFTIISQLAIGMILMGAGFDGYLISEAGTESAQKVMQWVIFISAPLLIIGLCVSFLHLGHPERATKAIYNMRHSWLSREGFLMGMLTGAICLLAILHLLGSVSSGLLRPILWATTLISLILIFCMSKIYQLRTVPSWNRNTTPIAFYATTILLGALAYAVVCVSCVQYTNGSGLTQILSILAILSLFLVGLQSAIISIGLARDYGNCPQIEGAVPSWKKYRPILVVRTVLGFVGLGFFGIALFTSFILMVYLAFIVVLASEVAGRFFFYAAHERVGI